jgi:hypothetical protein
VITNIGKTEKPVLSDIRNKSVVFRKTFRFFKEVTFDV